MAKFYLRTSKSAGESCLYLDVNRPKFGVRWKVNTGIKVTVAAWSKAQATAKALSNYYSTEEGKSVREKTDMCESVIKDYFDTIKNASQANKEKLESIIKEYVNTDIKERREELEKLSLDERKIEEERKRRSMGEVLRYYDYFLNGIKDGSMRHGEQKRYKASTISAWTTFGKHLRGFLESAKRPTMTFDDIDRKTATAFVTYLEKMELMKATITQQINHFRKLCNSAAEDGVNKNAVSMRVWKSHDQKDNEKRAEIVLSDYEVDALYDLHLEGHIEQCRDLWILGYDSGQRVSDFSELSRENFGVNDDGVPVIRVCQRKTGTEVEVPILQDRVFELCEKYNYNFPKLKRDAIGRGIKIACKMLAESVPTFNKWEVTLLAAKERDKELWFIEAKKRVSAGEKLHGEESKRFKRLQEYATEHDSGDMLYKRDYQGRVIRQRWELVSCHTTRRSMVTSLHKSGLLSDREIMSVTGHKTLKAYESYMKITATERATSIYEKMKKAKEIKMKKID